MQVSPQVLKKWSILIFSSLKSDWVCQLTSHTTSYDRCQLLSFLAPVWDLWGLLCWIPWSVLFLAKQCFSYMVASHMVLCSSPGACMCEEVKLSVLSFCQFVSLFVCQSGEKFLNLNIDRVKWFPKLTVALTLEKKWPMCTSWEAKRFHTLAFPAVPYQMPWSSAMLIR